METMSRSEEQVMLIIWRTSEGISMKEIHTKVNAAFGHEWAPQTVSTFLGRLCKKGWAEAEKQKGQSLYRPIVGFDTYRKMRLTDILTELYGGDSALLKEELAKCEENAS